MNWQTSKIPLLSRGGVARSAGVVLVRKFIPVVVELVEVHQHHPGLWPPSSAEEGTLLSPGNMTATAMHSSLGVGAFYRGGFSDETYAAMATMSSEDKFATISFINCGGAVGRVPC